MLILQCILTVLVFLTPYFAGVPFKRGSVPETYLYGQVLLWAVFQLLAVPMIFFRLSFNTLWITYAFVLTALTAFGIRRYVRAGARLPGIKPEKPFAQYVPLALALCVILFQVFMYVAGMHLDEDDSRFIAEANDAITHNTMYLHNPATGEYIGRFAGEMQKDRFSPWEMYLATLSRLTMLRPAVLAHTVYAPVLLLLSYAVYAQIGKRLFQGRFEQGAFLLSVSVVNLFFTGYAYSQPAFSLTRIWQGKGGVGAVAIPLFLLFLLELEKDDCSGNWMWLGAAGCATSLFSGMGVAFSAILILVYGGYAVIRSRFRRLPQFLASLLPSAVFGLLYLWWR